MGRQVDEAAVGSFRSRLRGAVLEPGDDGYDEARRVWNAMIDRRPALIARCTGAADVIAAVDLAREHDLLLTVKGGGHNVAGRAVCDEGLVIDCSPMNAVRVDPGRGTVRVQAGALLGDVDHETQAFGLATPAGVMSETGVAGLALGGGWGWLSRKYGMTVDNIRSVDLVTAQGELVRASEEANSELFWGIRGGGGNFGVVTSFEFDLHVLGPHILAGSVVYRMADAEEALRGWRDFMREAPDEVGSIAGFAAAPATPVLPEDVHGRTVVTLTAAYAGPIVDGERVLEPLRGFGDPIADTLQPTLYITHQRAGDSRQQAGDRVYVKSHYLAGLPDEAIDIAIRHADPIPTPVTTVGFIAMGGAINRVAPAATAFPHRDTAFEFDIGAKWSDRGDDDQHIAWARDFHEAMEPYSTGGVYGNVPSEDRALDAYAGNYDRLSRLKAVWDPSNLFRLNQNVQPAG